MTRWAFTNILILLFILLSLSTSSEVDGPHEEFQISERVKSRHSYDSLSSKEERCFDKCNYGILYIRTKTKTKSV